MKEFRGEDLYGNEVIYKFHGDLEKKKEMIILLLGYEPDDWESHVSEVWNDTD